MGEKLSIEMTHTASTSFITIDSIWYRSNVKATAPNCCFLLYFNCFRSLSLQLLRLSVLTVSTIFILYVRVITIGQGSPKFVESDNPASFSNSTQTKLFTYSYVNAYNVWLLLNPYPLCHDWSMGSIPLVETITDVRNLVTLSVTFSIAIIFIHATVTYNPLSSLDKQTDVTSTTHAVEESDDIQSRTKTSVLFSLFMALLPFVPASNLLFPVGFVIAERILYLPSMGYCLLVAIGFNAFKATRRSSISLVSDNYYCFSLLMQFVFLWSGIHYLPLVAYCVLLLT